MFYQKIFKLLNRNEVKYLVIGGIAVNLYGFFRVTGDLDIILEMSDENLKKFVDVVKYLGYKPKIPVSIDDFADRQKRMLWIKEKNMKVFTVYNPGNELEHIDVLVEPQVDFVKLYLRRSTIKAGNLQIPVVSIDDLIKLKKIAGRKRDQIDIEALKKIKQLRKYEK